MASSTKNAEVLEQCIWTLGNIAGDSPEYRNQVIQSGGCQIFMKVLEQFKGYLRLERISVWSLSNMHRGQPEPDYQLVQNTIPVILQCVNSTDQQIQSDAFWALSYITNGSQQSVDQIIQSPQLQQIVDALGKVTQLEILTPAQRAIGNLAAQTDNSITQTLLAIGVVQKLANLLKLNKFQILRETLWTLSNIAAGDSTQIQQLFDENVFQSVFELFNHSEVEIKQEAAYVICNALNGANDTQFGYFIHKLNLIDLLVSCLSQNIILDAIESLLEYGRNQQGNNLQGINETMDLFEQKGGLAKMELLSNDSNPIIQDRVYQIMGVYFGFNEALEENQNEVNLEIPSNGFVF